MGRSSLAVGKSSAVPVRENESNRRSTIQLTGSSLALVTSVEERCDSCVAVARTSRQIQNRFALQIRNFGLEIGQLHRQHRAVDLEARGSEQECQVAANTRKVKPESKKRIFLPRFRLSKQMHSARRSLM